MTIVSNDPIWWPFINASLIASYFVVAGSVGVMYDWALTFGQEVELIWVRYGGIGYVVINMWDSVPNISMTDAGCFIIYDASNWMSQILNLILGIIMIARLHAMYQQSRKLLIFLVVILLAITITNTVVVAILTMQSSGVHQAHRQVPEEFVLSGTFECTMDFSADTQFLISMTWILVIHFRELRRHSTSGIIGDCFAVLMQTHVSYFASFLAVSCFEIGLLSPNLLAATYSLDGQIYLGLNGIFHLVQLFVLGPRLILGVREYHAKLVANPDTATAMTSIVFEERVHVSTSSSRLGTSLAYITTDKSSGVKIPYSHMTIFVTEKR
ncbi:hypothetical protein BD769DRAFT_1392114 [Suillus cothurnatus]|nr:hypothetical protein BD769DRAFT_1392114 [Suillus cothurnatus]